MLLELLPEPCAKTQGKVAAAEGGTLFLDEIGDLPLPLQPKLLRLLQEKRYERVGEARTRVSDVRILAASNRDLTALVSEGTFREDLLYRLNVVEIVLPPLRQRPADILPLANHLLHFFAQHGPRPVEGFTDEAKGALLRYPWPGNVRELRNAVERSVILATGPTVGVTDEWHLDSKENAIMDKLGRRLTCPASRKKADLRAIRVTDLPAQVGSPLSGHKVVVGGRVTLDELEAEHMRRILSATTTLEEAATILGIDPSTLYRKGKRYGL